MSCYIFIIEYTCHSNKYRINVTAIEQNFKWVKKIPLSCFFYLTDEICSLIFFFFKCENELDKKFKLATQKKITLSSIKFGM